MPLVIGGATTSRVHTAVRIAPLPAVSVSGLYLSHPHSRYFAVGRIGDDQLADFARREAIDPALARRRLAVVLG